MIYGPYGTDNPSSPSRTLHQVYELLLIEMESAYSYSAALNSPKRTLHQVYELLLIEMEFAYSYSAALPRNARYTKYMSCC